MLRRVVIATKNPDKLTEMVAVRHAHEIRERHMTVAFEEGMVRSIQFVVDRRGD